jgi:phosphoribosylanthranilate isomerase
MARRTWIKICGVTRVEDAVAAAEAGADAIGLVFAESPRRLTAEQARLIVRELPLHVLRVGVFVDESPAEIARIVAAAELDRAQLHGFEEPMVRELIGTRVLRVFRAHSADVVDEIAASGERTFLLDTWSRAVAGGTGEPFDWSVARPAAQLGRLILAGGLTPENVGSAIRDVAPFGVDVSSGVETAPGIKDPSRVTAFVAAVHAADRERSLSA